jgi:putative effector of murein hydrolase LrgA (UPF0299 family)
MDLTQLLTPTLVFGLGCYFLALGLRRLLEGLFKKLVKNWFWEELGLPLLPALIGAGLVLVVPKFPFPAVFETSKMSLAFFGFVTGIISGWIYRAAKATVKKLWGVDLDQPSVPPPPMPPAPPGPTPPPDPPPPPAA